MIEVIAGAAAARADTSLVVRVAPYSPSPAARESTLGVAIADPALAARLTSSITAAIAHAIDDLFATPPPPLRTIQLRARATASQRADELPGALAIVPVTERNARHLLALVDQLRTAGVAGVQLVWDGAARPRIERHVFAVLEQARSTPAGPPVVLASTTTPAAALQLLVAHRFADRSADRSPRGAP